ncbi:MAG: rRNA maturation RNase YbeY [Candidatus Zixiibacteriota bacterium]
MPTAEHSPDPDPPRSSHRAGGRFQILIERDLSGGRVPRQLLKSAVSRVARGERARGVLRLVVVNDRRMRELNRQFRAKDRVTDVLSFPEGARFPGESGPLRLGEIYCNYDHARRWSGEVGGTVAAELMRLAVHGTLHLLGYDHHTPAERRVMAQREERYLSGAGLISARNATSRDAD